MADRRATNKYYPPGWTPDQGSINTYKGQHPLRDRARKLDQGILIIRFEMPWHIWCTTCHQMIGRGVRYNAEKKKTDMYYTTPIYEFSMKCHLCPGRIIMATDPKNCDYRIVSGASRKNETWEASATETIELMDHEDRAKMQQDPMFKLEHGAADKARARTRAPGLLQLIELKESFQNDYKLNSALRATFRGKKKELKAQEARDSTLQKKASLAIELVPELPEDVTLAQSIKFGVREERPVDLAVAARRAVKRASIFGDSGADDAASHPAKKRAVFSSRHSAGQPVSSVPLPQSVGRALPARPSAPLVHQIAANRRAVAPAAASGSSSSSAKAPGLTLGVDYDSCSS